MYTVDEAKEQSSPGQLHQPNLKLPYFSQLTFEVN